MPYPACKQGRQRKYIDAYIKRRKCKKHDEHENFKIYTTVELKL